MLGRFAHGDAQDERESPRQSGRGAGRSSHAGDPRDRAGRRGGGSRPRRGLVCGRRHRDQVPAHSGGGCWRCRPPSSSPTAWSAPEGMCRRTPRPGAPPASRRGTAQRVGRRPALQRAGRGDRPTRDGQARSPVRWPIACRNDCPPGRRLASVTCLVPPEFTVFAGMPAVMAVVTASAKDVVAAGGDRGGSSVRRVWLVDARNRRLQDVAGDHRRDQIEIRAGSRRRRGACPRAGSGSAMS
jgi:hypothetical protein